MLFRGLLLGKPFRAIPFDLVQEIGVMNEHDSFFMGVHGPIPADMIGQFLVGVPKRVLADIVFALSHFIPIVEHQLMSDEL